MHRLRWTAAPASWAAFRPAATTSSRATGWSERPAAPHWSTSVEFDHYDFGTRSLTLVDPNGAVGDPLSGPINVKQHIEALKLGINYRFGGP